MTTAIIQTVSGRYVDVLRPRPEDIVVGDIAHHLAHLCRFGGAVRRFYSVAEHSVRVARLLPPPLRLAGLLHDASEAYVADLASPIKRTLPSYQYVEDLVHDAVRQRFGLQLSRDDEAAIKRADIVLLATERRDLMPRDGMEWAVLAGICPLDERITPMPVEAARDAFLAAFDEYAQLDLLGA